jgi:hypothetical protein
MEGLESAAAIGAAPRMEDTLTKRQPPHDSEIMLETLRCAPTKFICTLHYLSTSLSAQCKKRVARGAHTQQADSESC